MLASPTATEFHTVYRAQVGFIWNLLRRLGVAERDLEDKAQDVFVVFLRRIDRYDPSRPVRPWLAGIAVRVAADHLRLHYHKREVAGPGLVEAVGPAAPPQAVEEQRAAKDLVLLALEQLSLEQRTVFVLHEIEGYAIPELVQLLAVPLNTLYSRLRLARQRFVAAVEQLEAEENTTTDDTSTGGGG